jgi:competence protein ComEC
MKVMQFPLVRISIAFLLGLLLAHFNPTSLFFSSFLLGFFFFFLVVFYLFFKNEIGFGVCVILSSFALGYWVTSLHYEPNHSNHFLNKIKEDEEYLIKLKIGDRLKNSKTHCRYQAYVIELNSKISQGKVILNFKDKLVKKLDNGTLLLLRSSFYLNKNPTNPNQFDYGKYLENQQIYAQLYTDFSNIKVDSKVEKNLSYYSSRIRTVIIQNLQKSHFKKEELSIVIALILGQQQDISKDTLQDYQYAGAIHILSVSGLHVGFIMLFIVTLLKPIPNSKNGLAIKLVITLLCLWAFGLVAGLAPSVVRSVTMFSFVAIGLFLKRSVNIFHSLMVSMLLILLVRPSFLFDVGFQLSYLALFFIIWLQPVLLSAWTPKNRIIIYFWEIITVSFAAQLGTLPLSIYYFHQFPGLFFLTNIIILPMLSIILAVALIVVVLAGLDATPQFLILLLEKSIELINTIIAWIASFEHFIFKDISMNIPLMLSSYLFIIAVTICIKKPNFLSIKFVLYSILSLQCCFYYTKFDTQNKLEFIVFNQKKQSLITVRTSRSVVAYTSNKKANIWSVIFAN